MARRRRGRRGKKKGGIPLLVVLPAIYPAVDSLYSCRANLKQIPVDMIWRYTGYAPGQAWNSGQGIQTLLSVLAGYAGHKIANKVGVNKYVKKLTMGWFTL